jgi:hypothetical protein
MAGQGDQRSPLQTTTSRRPRSHLRSAQNARPRVHEAHLRGLVGEGYIQPLSLPRNCGEGDLMVYAGNRLFTA